MLETKFETNMMPPKEVNASPREPNVRSYRKSVKTIKGTKDKLEKKESNHFSWFQLNRSIDN